MSVAVAPYRPLELRDLEILRALLRVRYLTTRQINAFFFSCPRIGRRRIQRLSELDLIRPHTKGMPEALHYSAWRLTSRGVDEVARAFPDEPVRDGLVDRVASGSLHHALHREALAELYLHLVVPQLASTAERDLGAHRRWGAELRRRASAISWQPDGDVVLTTSFLGQRVDVVPDAVVRAVGTSRRVFVELDRSTKDLGRIRDCLERYVRVLGDADDSGASASVLFVVRSYGRRAGIQAMARDFGALHLVVHCEKDGVEWLRKELLSIAPEPQPASRDDKLRAVTIHAYNWMHRLQKLMRTNGMRQTLVSEHPDLMKDGDEKLQALLQLLLALEKEGARP